jgi:hypothetical protein
MDIHVESRLLLERLANSLFDREPRNPSPVFFTVKEAHIVEDWLKQVVKEAMKELGEY